MSVETGELCRRHGITRACFYRWKSKFGGLNENWFSDLADAREKIAQWKQDYNEKRPHRSLQYRTPMEFAAQSAAGFYRAELGQEASNAGPLPPDPHPRYAEGSVGRTKTGESLIIRGLKMGGRSPAYAANELDRSVVAKDQIRTIIQTFRDRLFTEIFQRRSATAGTHQ